MLPAPKFRQYGTLARVIIALTVGIVLVVLSIITSGNASAQACTNPGTGASTDYNFDGAMNTYIVCNILSAQATVIALPTATLAPTPAAVASQTGCLYNASNPSLYQLCVTEDARARSESYVYWAIPLILVAIIAFGVTQRGRWMHKQ